MRTTAARLAISVLVSVACVGVIVACGGAPLSAPSPAVVSVSEAATIPPIQVTVHAAETANAVSFVAQTAAARARALTDMTTLVPPVQATLSPSIAPTAIPSTSVPLPAQTPAATTATTNATPVPVPSAYTAAYPLISVADLVQRRGQYENIRFSVIGYVYNVHHVRTGTTTFFLASDAERSNSIFVSLEGMDSKVQENAEIQVYGTGAQTIRVVTDGNTERESPFMRAVLIRPAR